MHIEQAEGRGRRAAFLVALQQGRSVTRSAQAAGVNRTLLYKWREQIPGFAAAWDEARETSADLIEDEAMRRAMQGVQKPVFYRGAQIGVITTYSDRLLALLLQRRRPVPRAARPGVAAYAMASANVSTGDVDNAFSEDSPILSPTVSLGTKNPGAAEDPVVPSPDLVVLPVLSVSEGSAAKDLAVGEQCTALPAMHEKGTWLTAASQGPSLRSGRREGVVSNHPASPGDDDGGISEESPILSPPVSMDEADPATDADPVVPSPGDAESAYSEALAFLSPTVSLAGKLIPCPSLRCGEGMASHM